MELDNTTLYLTLDSILKDGSTRRSCLGSQYYDLDGKEYMFNSYSSSIDEEKHTIGTEYKIENFRDHYYKLRWNYAPLQLLDDPVEIIIK